MVFMAGKYGEVPKLALLIAGGEGTGLRPITYEIPKVLIPVKGRPLLDQLIDELLDVGVERFVLAIGYKADMIKEHFDKSKYKDVIEYVVEEKKLGDGGAVRLALDERKDEDFIALYGDNLWEMGSSLSEMYAIHKKEKAMATLALKEVKDVTGLGIVVLKGNVITQIVEKPKPEEAPSNLASTGLYIINRKQFQEALPDAETFGLVRDMLEKTDKKLCGYVFRGDWRMTDNVQRYEDAIFHWVPLSERKKSGK